ncbi:hypothetical protein CJ030_MR7G014278 [Morella rubra]|uniref:Uncharacterized protein n=1 Tax=Morella rubra TaxID=262757 RepID=A0A6A1V0G6_9ROSI|nr:hypothetical protein CJ030_MR7G014278 [Morella rubra]
MEKCKETKWFKNRGCEHIELLDRLWKDAAKVKKVRIVTGMHGANDEGEVKLEAAACRSDSLQRHGQLGGSSTASFQMGPNSVPPTTSMDTGSRKRPGKPR